MRQTKENAIKLLAAMLRNTLDVARDMEADNPQIAREWRHEADGFQQAIWLLTDASYFKKIENIYFPSENE